MQLIPGAIVQILGPNNKHQYYGTVIRNSLKSDFQSIHWGLQDFKYPHRFLVISSQNGLEHFHEARLVYIWKPEQEELKNDARK